MQEILRRRASVLSLGISLCACLVAAMGLSAPPEVTTLAPGDAALARVQLAPFLARYDLQRLDEGGAHRTVGAWERHLQRATIQGQPAWQHVYAMSSPAATVYDRVHFADGSFAPLARRVSAPGLDLVMVAAGGALEVTQIETGGAVEHSTYELPGGRFAGGVELALGQLELGPGTVVELPSVATDPPMIGTLLTRQVRVLGRETIEAAGREWSCLEVETTWKNPDGSAVEGVPAGRLWVAAEPPYLVRQEMGPMRWILAAVVDTSMK